MSYRLKSYGRRAYRYLDVLENQVEMMGTTVQEVIKREHFDMACKKVSVGNSIISINKQLSSKGYRKKEPLDSKYPSKQPRYLREAMNMMKNDLNITGDRFVDMLKEMKLSLNRDMIERILNLKEGFLSDTKEDEEVVLEMKSNNL